MPELNFNLLAQQGPQNFMQGYVQGNELRNRMVQQEQQQQLSNLQLQNALREQRMAGEEESAYKAAGNDLTRLQQELMSRGLGKQSMAVGAQLSKQQADKMTMLKQQHDLIKTAASQVFANPEAAIQTLTGFGQRTGIDMSDDIAQIQALGGDPVKIQKWASGIAIEADKLLPKFQQFDLNGAVVTGAVDPLTGQFRQGTAYQKSMTPGEAERLAISRGQLDVSQRRVALDEEAALRASDPEFQQRMAYSKAMGEAAAKGDTAAKQQFPKVVAQANQAVQLIDQLVGQAPQKDKNGKIIPGTGTAPHPGFRGAVGMGTWHTLGIPGVAQLTPGTDAADFKALYDQVKSGAFLQAFESLKGAGAITEKEGEKATAAITRMSLAQSEGEFLKAAREFQDNIRMGVKNAEQKVLSAGTTASNQPAPAAPGGNEAALNWARANPKDPRAAAILQRLGAQ